MELTAGGRYKTVGGYMAEIIDVNPQMNAMYMAHVWVKREDMIGDPIQNVPISYYSSGQSNRQDRCFDLISSWDNNELAAYRPIEIDYEGSVLQKEINMSKNLAQRLQSCETARSLYKVSKFWDSAILHCKQLLKK